MSTPGNAQIRRLVEYTIRSISDMKLAKSLTRNSSRPCEPSDKQKDGGCVYEGGGRLQCALKILGEAPVPVDPGEESFDHPAARQHRKPDLVGQFVDDLDDDPRRVGDALAFIGAVGEDAFDERKRPARLVKQRYGAVTILRGSGVT